MKDVLIWEQGGVTNMVFAKHIISIQERSKDGYCDIQLIGYEEAMQSSLKIADIYEKLNIDRFA